MAVARASAVAVEILAVPVPLARLASTFVEVLAAEPIPQARLASTFVEVLSAREPANSTLSRKDLIFVAEIDRATDSAGTIETIYSTDSTGWRTLPTDTPANEPIAATLRNPGTYRREMFSGNRTFGAVRPAFGEAVLSNLDGRYDSMKADGFDGRTYKLWAGRHGYPFPGSGADAFVPVFVCTMDSAIVDFDEVRLKLRDRLQLLDKTVLVDTFAGTGDLEGTTAFLGKPKQRIFGDPLYTPVVPVLMQVPIVRYTTTGPTYDIAASYEGTIPASEVLLRFKFSRLVTFIAGLAPSTATVAAATTATKAFTLYQNGASIGSMTFAAGESVATFSLPADTIFEIDDVLTVTAPATPDVTLAGLAFTLSGFV